jgi:hypothetical protein
VLWGCARALKHLVKTKPKIKPDASNSVVRKGSLKWIKANGKWIQRRRVSGIPRKLKQTQVYPLAFCNEVARLSLVSPLRWSVCYAAGCPFCICVCVLCGQVDHNELLATTSVAHTTKRITSWCCAFTLHDVCMMYAWHVNMSQ